MRSPSLTERAHTTLVAIMKERNSLTAYTVENRSSDPAGIALDTTTEGVSEELR